MASTGEPLSVNSDTTSNIISKQNQISGIQKGLESVLADSRKSYEDKFGVLVGSWDCLSSFVCSKPLIPVHQANVTSLLKWIHPITLRLVIHPCWQKLKNISKTTITHALKRCLSLVKADEDALVVESIVKITKDPWSHPILIKMFDKAYRNTDHVTDSEVLEYCNSEGAMTLAIRLEALTISKCDNFCDRLSEACMRTLKLDGCSLGHLGVDGDHRYLDFIMDIRIAVLVKKKQLRKMLSQLKHFELEEGHALVQRFLGRRCANGTGTGSVDPCLVAEVDRDRTSLWAVSSEVVVIATQYFITSAMVDPVNNTKPFVAMMTTWFKLHSHLLDAIPNLTEGLVKSAASSRHVFLLADVLIQQFGGQFTPLCIEYYIRGLLLSVNELEYLKTFKVKDMSLIREMEIRMSDGFIKLANLTQANRIVYRESFLTAFSLNPTRECLDQLKKIGEAQSRSRPAAPGACRCSRPRNGQNADTAPSPKEGTVSVAQGENLITEGANATAHAECVTTEGANATAQRANLMAEDANATAQGEKVLAEDANATEEGTNAMKDFAKAKLCATVADTDYNTKSASELPGSLEGGGGVLCSECGSFLEAEDAEEVVPNRSSWCQVAVDNEGLGLSPQLCDDLLVVLSSPRWRLLSWAVSWRELASACELYLQNAPSRNTDKELTFLNKNIDYDQFDCWKYPKITDDEFPGIEKGYENCLLIEDDDEEDEMEEPRKSKSFKKQNGFQTDSDSTGLEKKKSRRKWKKSDDADYKVKPRAKPRPVKKRNIFLSSVSEYETTTQDSVHTEPLSEPTYSPAPSPVPIPVPVAVDKRLSDPKTLKQLRMFRNPAKSTRPTPAHKTYAPMLSTLDLNPRIVLHRTEDSAQDRPKKPAPLSTKNGIRASLENHQPQARGDCSVRRDSAAALGSKTRPVMGLDFLSSVLLTQERLAKDERADQRERDLMKAHIPGLATLDMMVPLPAETCVHIVQLPQNVAASGAGGGQPTPPPKPASQTQPSNAPEPIATRPRERVTLTSLLQGQPGLSYTIRNVAPQPPPPPAAKENETATSLPKPVAAAEETTAESESPAANDENTAAASPNEALPKFHQAFTKATRVLYCQPVATETAPSQGTEVETPAPVPAPAIVPTKPDQAISNLNLVMAMQPAMPVMPMLRVVQSPALAATQSTVYIGQLTTSAAGKSSFLAGVTGAGTAVTSRALPLPLPLPLPKDPRPAFMKRPLATATAMTNVTQDICPVESSSNDDAGLAKGAAANNASAIAGTNTNIQVVRAVATYVAAPAIDELKSGGGGGDLSPRSTSTYEQLQEFESVLKQIKEKGEIQGDATSIPSPLTTQPAVQLGLPCLKVAMSRIASALPNVVNVGNALKAPGVGVKGTKLVQLPNCPGLSTPVLAPSTSVSNVCVAPVSAAVASPGKTPPKSGKSSKPKSAKTSPSTSMPSTATAAAATAAAGSKSSPVPKPAQKPQEDEQTTQRIYAILDQYAEQLRNSPDLNNKPAPRRRSNPPTNPGPSKRKKSSSSSAAKAKAVGSSLGSGAGPNPGMGVDVDMDEPTAMTMDQDDDEEVEAEDDSSTMSNMMLNMGGGGGGAHESPAPSASADEGQSVTSVTASLESSTEGGNLKSVVTDPNPEATPTPTPSEPKESAVETGGGKPMLVASASAGASHIFMPSNIRQILMQSLMKSPGKVIHVVNGPAGPGGGQNMQIVLRQTVGTTGAGISAICGVQGLQQRTRLDHEAITLGLSPVRSITPISVSTASLCSISAGSVATPSAATSETMVVSRRDWTLKDLPHMMVEAVAVTLPSAVQETVNVSTEEKAVGQAMLDQTAGTEECGEPNRATMESEAGEDMDVSASQDALGFPSRQETTVVIESQADLEVDSASTDLSEAQKLFQCEKESDEDENIASETKKSVADSVAASVAGHSEDVSPPGFLAVVLGSRAAPSAKPSDNTSSDDETATASQARCPSPGPGKDDVRPALVTNPAVLGSVRKYGAKRPGGITSAVNSFARKVDFKPLPTRRPFHDQPLHKSLSEECEDLGVDRPSASELFPEAHLLIDADTSSSPSFEGVAATVAPCGIDLAKHVAMFSNVGMVTNQVAARSRARSSSSSSGSRSCSSRSSDSSGSHSSTAVKRDDPQDAGTSTLQESSEEFAGALESNYATENSNPARDSSDTAVDLSCHSQDLSNQALELSNQALELSNLSEDLCYRSAKLERDQSHRTAILTQDLSRHPTMLSLDRKVEKPELRHQVVRANQVAEDSVLPVPSESGPPIIAREGAVMLSAETVADVASSPPGRTSVIVTALNVDTERHIPSAKTGQTTTTEPSNAVPDFDGKFVVTASLESYSTARELDLAVTGISQVEKTLIGRQSATGITEEQTHMNVAACATLVRDLLPVLPETMEESWKVRKSEREVLASASGVIDCRQLTPEEVEGLKVACPELEAMAVDNITTGQGSVSPTSTTGPNIYDGEDSNGVDLSSVSVPDDAEQLSEQEGSDDEAGLSPGSNANSNTNDEGTESRLLPARYKVAKVEPVLTRSQSRSQSSQEGGCAASQEALEGLEPPKKRLTKKRKASAWESVWRSGVPAPGPGSLPLETAAARSARSAHSTDDTTTSDEEIPKRRFSLPSSVTAEVPPKRMRRARTNPGPLLALSTPNLVLGPSAEQRLSSPVEVALKPRRTPINWTDKITARMMAKEAATKSAVKSTKKKKRDPAENKKAKRPKVDDLNGGATSTITSTNEAVINGDTVNSIIDAVLAQGYAAVGTTWPSEASSVISDLSLLPLPSESSDTLQGGMQLSPDPKPSVAEPRCIATEWDLEGTEDSAISHHKDGADEEGWTSRTEDSVELEGPQTSDASGETGSNLPTNGLPESGQGQLAGKIAAVAKKRGRKKKVVVGTDDTTEASEADTGSEQGGKKAGMPAKVDCTHAHTHSHGVAPSAAGSSGYGRPQRHAAKSSTCACCNGDQASSSSKKKHRKEQAKEHAAIPKVDKKELPKVEKKEPSKADKKESSRPEKDSSKPEKKEGSKAERKETSKSEADKDSGNVEKVSTAKKVQATAKNMVKLNNNRKR